MGRAVAGAAISCGILRRCALRSGARHSEGAPVADKPSSADEISGSNSLTRDVRMKSLKAWNSRRSQVRGVRALKDGPDKEILISTGDRRRARVLVSPAGRTSTSAVRSRRSRRSQQSSRVSQTAATAISLAQAHQKEATRSFLLVRRPCRAYDCGWRDTTQGVAGKNKE